jgi:protein SPT2
MSQNVMSDDEDMEADMTALEREELTRFVPCIFRDLLSSSDVALSARIARKEDLEAEEEERRREEEKRRRRRKEQERSG